MKCLFLCLLCFCQPAAALVVLQYHHIADDTPASTSTSPARFAEHLAILQQEGFRVIDLPTAIKAIKDQDIPLTKTVLITFDDAAKSVFSTALPLLKEYQFPFVVFVNTDAVDQKISHTMSWQDIKTLTQFGGAIANHTQSHTHMVRQWPNESDQAWLTRMHKEITNAQARIKEQTGHDYPVLAYPFGEYDLRLTQQLKNWDIIAFGQHSGPVMPGNTQSIPRFPMGAGYGNRDDFLLKINTQPFPAINIQRVDKHSAKEHNPVLPKDLQQPTVAITLEDPALANAVECYLSPGDKTQKTRVDATTVHFQATQNHPIGRSRFNCTAPKGDGSYYWHSIPFIRRMNDGNWPVE